VSILDHELSAAIARGPRLSPEIAWVDRQLRQRPGVQIGALAAELDWSRGRLVDGFRREVGMPPKTLARVLRFGGARDELTAHTARPSFAELTVRRGYADQSHFNREFREFSGQTPTEFLADLGAS
jgi:AraC-like DNA-binding protein